MAFLIGSGFFALYFFTTNQVFSFDAVTNALVCESVNHASLFHSNHLLYPLLGAIWFHLERLCGYGGYAIYSLARFNSLMMAVGLALFYRLGTRFLSRFRAFVWTAVLGSTYAVWHYAVDGRAVGLTVFFGTLVLMWLSTLSTKKTIRTQDAVMMAIFSSLYVFSHAIAIFHVFPVAWAFWKMGGRKKAAAYLAETFALIGGIYVIVYVALGNTLSIPEFVRWGLGYTSTGGLQRTAESPFWADSAAQVFSGVWVGWVNALLNSNFWLSQWVAIVTFIAVIGSLRRARALSGTQKIVYLTCLFWGALVTIFIAFWSPGQEGFRLHVLLPWWLALALAYKSEKWFFQAASLIGTVVFSLNFSGPIYRDASIKNNEGYQLISELSSHLDDDDIVLVANATSLPGYEVLRPYFFPKIYGGSLTGWLLTSPDKSLTPLRSHYRVQLTRGRRIFATGDLYNPSVQADIEKTYALEPGSVGSFVHSFHETPAFTLSNGLSIVALNP